LFHGPVPEAFIRSLRERRLELSPELAAHFDEHGKTWNEVFGEAADEVFMAWNYATYIEAVARAGKHEYLLPTYVNAQLPAAQERAGEYPSGGPHPYFLEVWRAAAPSVDFYSPDIYWPNFEYWVERYEIPGNRCSCRRRGWKAAPTMHSMPMAGRTPSALARSQSTIWRRLRRVINPNRE
jgi:beta-galactosidase GanA